MTGQGERPSLDQVGYGARFIREAGSKARTDRKAKHDGMPGVLQLPSRYYADIGSSILLL
jgi:hypothetical protein